MARSRRQTGEVRLTDPGALRALAHPARVTIVDELYQGLERTASELAELTGLSPSATSYHLRALERWGVVERASGRNDGRERPWRAPARSLVLVPESASTAAAIDVVAGAYFGQLRDAARRWALAEPAESEAWRQAGTIRRSFLWLTESEAASLAAELDGALSRYTSGRDAAQHPPGTRRVLGVLALVPEVEG